MHIARTRSLANSMFVATTILVAIPAQDQAKPTTEVVEIAIKKKPKTPGASFFGNEGLEIKLLARVPGTTIIALDKGGTICKSFADDQGTDLKAGMKTGFFHWASMQKSFGDGPKDTVTVTIATKTLPANKAGRAKITAELALVTAKGSAEARQKIKLQDGAKITAGPVAMTIASVKPNERGSSKLNVQFQSNQSLDSIQKIEFLDDAGQPIKTENRGSGRMGFGNSITYSKGYGLAKAVGEVTLKITYYEDAKKVTLPLVLDVGLGW